MFILANIRPIGHNVGNDAIHFNLRRMIEESFGRVVSVVDIAATTKYGGDKAGLSAGTVHDLNRFADGVIVGGGNLFENNELFVDEQALISLQPPLMLFSNSRGEIYGREGKLIPRSDAMPDQKLAMLLERADVSVSRDSVTNKYLQKINPKDSLGWCPTINSSKYSEFLPPLSKGEQVGALVAVRAPSLMNVSHSVQARTIEHVSSAISALRENGHSRVRILCNDSRDLDFASYFRFTDGVDTVYTRDVYQYLSLLKNSEALVSYRLHATIPAVAFGVPTLNLTYDERAETLLQDLDLGASVLNIATNWQAGSEAIRARVNALSKSGFQFSTQVSEWESKSRIQFQRLEEFRVLVEQYVNRTGIAT